MHEGAAQVLERSSYATMARREVEARISAFSLAERVAGGSLRPSIEPELRGQLEGTLRVQRFIIAIASIHEAIDELGLETWGQLAEHGSALRERAVRIAGFDIDEVIGDAEPGLVKARSPETPLAKQHVMTMVSLAQTVVESWPMDAMCATARAVAAPMEHPLRVGHAWLKAFVRRHSAGDNHSKRVAARAYAEARLSIDELAAILGETVPDSLEWLDANGFGRRVSDMQLADDKRARAYELLRADRRRRQGLAEPQRDRLERDVLATQRIEDVDARPWIATNR